MPKFQMPFFSGQSLLLSTTMLNDYLIFISTGFSFLNNLYCLLYQSLIPNCKLTVNILKENLEISDNTKDYILEGDNPRIRCQRVLNLLIVNLDRERDYMQFCFLYNMISVMTDLPYKLITGNVNAIMYLCSVRNKLKLIFNCIFNHVIIIKHLQPSKYVCTKAVITNYGLLKLTEFL